MKTSSLILALVSLASANLLAARDSSITTSPSATTTSYSLSPVATCLAACSAGDVQCEAACVGSAHPNSLQVNQTDDCVAKCPQGDGSESASEQYSTCVQGCISSYYPSTQTVAGASVATVTSVSATTTGTATGKATGSGTATTGSSASGTGSAATTSTSKAAGTNNTPFLTSAGGLAGLFLAFFAL